MTDLSTAAPPTMVKYVNRLKQTLPSMDLEDVEENKTYLNFGYNCFSGEEFWYFFRILDVNIDEFSAVDIYNENDPDISTEIGTEWSMEFAKIKNSPAENVTFEMTEDQLLKYCPELLL